MMGVMGKSLSFMNKNTTSHLKLTSKRRAPKKRCTFGRNGMQGRGKVVNFSTRHCSLHVHINLYSRPLYACSRRISASTCRSNAKGSGLWRHNRDEHVARKTTVWLFFEEYQRNGSIHNRRESGHPSSAIMSWTMLPKIICGN